MKFLMCKSILNLVSRIRGSQEVLSYIVSILHFIYEVLSFLV